MTAKPPPEHLTPDQVLRLLKLVQNTKAVTVGGQAINVWAEIYAGKVPDLAALGPFTSKDIDFFGSRADAEPLADGLIDGRIHVPPPEDVTTPNSAMVTGKLDGREIEVDFLAALAGVDTKAVHKRQVELEIGDVSLRVLHPLDCLRSRLGNLNLLGRDDPLAVRQAKIAIQIVKAWIDDMLAHEEIRQVQQVLRQLEYVIRDDAMGQRADGNFGIVPDEILEAFVHDTRLDERWRAKTLTAAITRLKDRRGRIGKRSS